jgi:hypothetical protein
VIRVSEDAPLGLSYERHAADALRVPDQFLDLEKGDEIS